MDAIRVLIADDHEPFRRGLRTMLRSEADITVVGEAGNGPGAIARADSTQPDVVLMDVKMPGLDGLEATRRILNTSPHIRVLVLTMADDAESVFTALQAGARGYLVKGALKADVLRAIRGVAAGDARKDAKGRVRRQCQIAQVLLGSPAEALQERPRGIEFDEQVTRRIGLDRTAFWKSDNKTRPRGHG